MSVAKMIEISAQSNEGFHEAINLGVTQATKTLKNVQSAWVKNQEVLIDKNRITTYRVQLKVTFLLDE